MNVSIFSKPAFCQVILPGKRREAEGFVHFCRITAKAFPSFGNAILFLVEEESGVESTLERYNPRILEMSLPSGNVTD